jgi:uncharacterized protein YggE
MRIIVAAAIVAMLPAPAFAQDAVRTSPVLLDGTLLDVTAEGKTTRVPDVATIRAGVVTQAVTAADALSQNATRISKVLAALKAAGVADRDVQTATISLAPQYRYGENQPPIITGYQATNNVSVRFRDIARSGTILDALVREGANQIDGPNLSIDKPEAALDEARTAAIVSARARAELYAKAAGLRVERILTISEGSSGGGMPVPVMMVARSAGLADSSKIAAGEQEVSVSVSVRFLLK